MSKPRGFVLWCHQLFTLFTVPGSLAWGAEWMMFGGAIHYGSNRTLWKMRACFVFGCGWAKRNSNTESPNKTAVLQLPLTSIKVGCCSPSRFITSLQSHPKNKDPAFKIDIRSSCFLWFLCSTRFFWVSFYMFLLQKGYSSSNLKQLSEKVFFFWIWESSHIGITGFGIEKCKTTQNDKVADLSPIYFPETIRHRWYRSKY